MYRSAITLAGWIDVDPLAGEPGNLIYDRTPPLRLDSSFSLSTALKFGLVFLALNVVGALAEKHFGSANFYFVSAAGGLLSSGSSIASVASLIHHGELRPATSVNGVVISSVTSVLINSLYCAGFRGPRPIAESFTFSLLSVAVMGILWRSESTRYGRTGIDSDT